MKRLLSLAAGMMFSTSVLAMPITIGFDDGVVPNTGIISWDGSGALIGTDIDFSTVDGTGVSANSGPANALECVGCYLNFETGAFLGQVGSTLNFDAGGSFILTGTVFDPGSVQVATGTLLEGSFDGVLGPSIGFTGSTSIFLSTGVDMIAQPIVDYFAVESANFGFASTAISLGSCTSSNPGFECVVTNADIDNVSQAVPEPATAAMLPLGLLALAGMRRRRKA